MSSSSPTRVQDEKSNASQEDAQADREELLSQKTTELSRSIFHLIGNGSVDCSEALWTPWHENGQDMAPKLWRYREAIITKAQRLESLMGSKELWTKNDGNEATHVKNSLTLCLDALFPRIGDAKASLYVCLCRDGWLMMVADGVCASL